jgi:Sir2 family
MPTFAHMAVKALVDHGLVQYVVSQNVDGLHLRSGLARTLLSELHGNVCLEECARCGREYLRHFEIRTVGRKPTARRCVAPSCGAQLRATALDWEDALSERELSVAERECASADLSLCVGTSLRMMPAAHLPTLSRALVVCNLQRTPLTDRACLSVRSRVDLFFRLLFDALGLPPPALCTPPQRVHAAVYSVHPDDKHAFLTEQQWLGGVREELSACVLYDREQSGGGSGQESSECARRKSNGGVRREKSAGGLELDGSDGVLEAKGGRDLRQERCECERQEHGASPSQESSVNAVLSASKQSVSEDAAASLSDHAGVSENSHADADRRLVAKGSPLQIASSLSAAASCRCSHSPQHVSAALSCPPPRSSSPSPRSTSSSLRPLSSSSSSPRWPSPPPPCLFVPPNLASVHSKRQQHQHHLPTLGEKRRVSLDLNLTRNVMPKQEHKL